MSKLNIAVIGDVANNSSARQRKKSLHASYLSADEFTAHPNPQSLIADRQIVVFQEPQQMSRASNKSFRALAMLRDIGTVSVVYVTRNKLKKEMAAQLTRNGFGVVRGDYDFGKAWRTLEESEVDGLAAAVRQSRFEWKQEPKKTLPEAVSAPFYDDLDDLMPAHEKLLRILSGGDFCGVEYLTKHMKKHLRGHIKPAYEISRMICTLNPKLLRAELPPVKDYWGLGRRWPMRLTSELSPK